MAKLEFIQFNPSRETVKNGKICWDLDQLAKPIANLPQLFWNDGSPWSEANHWALTKTRGSNGSKLKTVVTLLKHLVAYASWLEESALDWRHFPMRREDRAIVMFRGELIRQRADAILRPSTASGRMSAVIQFYRHVQIFELLGKASPFWQDKQVFIRIHDSTGFQRTLVRSSSELSIPNRARPGEVLEDGLTPLQAKDAEALLAFTDRCGLFELHYMLSIGTMTGARLDTIVTLGVENLNDALPDYSTPDFHRIRVGPGTGVNTKFDVSGYLLMPTFLLEALKRYATSMRRLRRQALASPENRGCLFLTIRGNPYDPPSFNRLMTDLRRRSISEGMRFMTNFKFHQTRATFGTMAMELALSVASVKDAVAFVKDAMFHKHESTTFRYVSFVQKAPIKAKISDQFSIAFSGISSRKWNDFKS